MNTAHKLLSCLLLSLLAAVVNAQEAGESTAPTELDALQPTWWEHYEGTADEVQPRVEAFFEIVEAETGNLQAANQDVAQSVIEAVRDNFTAYLALLGQSEPKPQAVPEASIS